MSWNELHISRADAPQKIDILPVKSLYQFRLLGLQTKLVKVQQGLKALHLLRDMKLSQKIQESNRMLSCGAGGVSYTVSDLKSVHNLPASVYQVAV